MRLQYHPAVRQDVAGAMRRYKTVSQKLADDFKAELRGVIAMALANPGRFHPVKPGFHRANLKRFPYKPDETKLYAMERLPMTFVLCARPVRW